MAGITFSGMFENQGACAEVVRKQEVEPMMTAALLDLPRYIEWPEGVFVLKRAPVMVGVYGQTALGREIAAQAKDQMVNGRRILVRRYSWPAEPNCNMLLIARSEKGRLSSILEKVAYAPVVTISEHEDFGAQGCMMRLFVKDGQPRFEVNIFAVTNASLKVSARLLAVSDVKWERPPEKAPEPAAERRRMKRMRMKNAE